MIVREFDSDELPINENRIQILKLVYTNPDRDASDEDAHFRIEIGSKHKKDLDSYKSEASIQFYENELRQLYDALAEHFDSAVSKQTIIDKFNEFAKELADNL